MFFKMNKSLKLFFRRIKKSFIIITVLSLIFEQSFLTLKSFAEEIKDENVTVSEDSASSEDERTKRNEDTSEPLAEHTVLKGYVSKIPSGTKFRIILETPIDEIISKVDDEITGKISEDIILDGLTAIPANSTVVGEISEINPAKRLHKAGTVRIEFKNLTFPDGRQIPIVASVLTKSGLVKGKYTKKTALISTATVLAPAAAGFGAGLAADGSAVGASIGAAVGVLAGIALFAFQRGNKVYIKAGDEMDIELVEEALVPKSGDEDFDLNEEIQKDEEVSDSYSQDDLKKDKFNIKEIDFSENQDENSGSVQELPGSEQK